MNAPGSLPQIDHERCTACALCAAVCDSGSLQVQGSYAALTLPELCDQCGLCAEVCPEEAIELAFGIVWGDGQQGKGG